MAWAAINRNRKMGTIIPSQSSKKAIATKNKDIIYPKEPMYISVFLPNLSIKYRPKRVNNKLVTPIPILLNKEALASKPADSNILGA